MMTDTDTALEGAPHSLPKAPSGIDGFDDITLGGLPAGRPTLVCGGAGCGKTLFAMTFLVNGATRFGEPGVFMSFEERAEDLAANIASLNVDVPDLVATGRLAIDHVRVERGEIEENGEYDLEGLFVRLGYAIRKIGARRVVLDTVEALFSGFTDTAILRAELRRLFGWLKDQGVTAVITGERGDRGFTRHGLEEYVSDCVILLDNRVEEQITTRRLRIVKYRGSAHGTNEYPFLIDGQGISVVPITSAGLAHKTSDEPVSSGVPGLDAMLGASGFYRGSSILVTGGSGTGKTIFGAKFAEATCRRGERCLLFTFEESPEQLVRNVRSVGLDLRPFLDAGLLRIESARPSLFGFEMHLARMIRDVRQFQPTAVVVDPISAFHGPSSEIQAAMLRLIDILKDGGITALFTGLTAATPSTDADHLVSSLMDSWISLRGIEDNGERNRALYVLKSRGMSHSNQIREYRLTAQGIVLITPYLGPDGVMTGTARLAAEARERSELARRRRETEQRRRDLARKQASIERQIAEMRAALEAEAAEVAMLDEQAASQERSREQDRDAMAAVRGAAE